MAMSLIWAGTVALSILCAAANGAGASLSRSVPEGAQAGITLGISLAGSLCLWSGVGALMQRAGITGFLSRLLGPVLKILFPSCRSDAALEDSLSANVCANMLGLGNAATPMGIAAAKRLRRGDTATDELCRLVVLNTASIQLIPTNVAAVRSALGAEAPFSILGAVWLSSFCSAALGVTFAVILGRLAQRQ